MENVSAIIGLIGVAVGIVSLLIYVSLDREKTTKKILILVLVILLPLAYLVYPEGITTIPFASLTLGEIGRLFVSGILVLFFTVGQVYLIRGMRDY